ncbi:helix-turn-helix domain-containing protein [Leifsonia sp. Leaf336]|uniref:helix-turn-helix domain-containing protein n=1 Tax=Leifsonia sp. Leaf336 TaxID=1736341 RepID=UPI00138F1FF5|nr:helix-turn-helix domain-containing protein [Leifsonia sp. Leaf336]
MLLTDLGEQRRRRMGTIRSDILELLDALHPVASDIGSLSIPQDRMLMAEVGDSQPVLLSVTRVADRLGLSTRAVTNMLTSGRLHGSKDIDGRHWVVSEEDLNNYMNGKAA